MKKIIIQLDSRFRGNDKRLEPILYTSTQILYINSDTIHQLRYYIHQLRYYTSTQILTNVMNRLKNPVYDNHF